MSIPLLPNQNMELKRSKASHAFIYL